MDRPEQEMHKAIFQHLRWRGSPGLVAFHVPNGAFFGGNRAVQGKVLQEMGVLAGVSDIIALHDGKMFCLEVKAPGRRPTVAQLTFIEDVNDAGGFAGWTDNLDRALQILEMWKLLRPNLSTTCAVAQPIPSESAASNEGKRKKDAGLTKDQHGCNGR